MTDNHAENIASDGLPQNDVTDANTEAFSVQATQERLSKEAESTNASLAPMQPELRKGGYHRFTAALWFVLGALAAAALSASFALSYNNSYNYEPSNGTDGVVALFGFVSLVLVVVAVIYVFIGLSERTQRAEYDYDRALAADQLLKAIAEEVGIPHTAPEGSAEQSATSEPDASAEHGSVSDPQQPSGDS